MREVIHWCSLVKLDDVQVHCEQPWIKQACTSTQSRQNPQSRQNTHARTHAHTHTHAHAHTHTQSKKVKQFSVEGLDTGKSSQSIFISVQ